MILRIIWSISHPVDSKQGVAEAHGGDIELRGVRFRYDGADDDTLRGIDLTIRQGEHIAVVGQNGAGKTTLVKLLMRLYDPTAGRTPADGDPAADYRLDSYRASFGTVFQDYTPTAFSVAENVSAARIPQPISRPCSRLSVGRGSVNA